MICCYLHLNDFAVQLFRTNINRQKQFIGFIGTQLDSGSSAGRWEKWRPTVSLVQHEALVIDRMVLLYDPKYPKLRDIIRDDIAAVSPETEVKPVEITIADPWDFG